MLVKYFLLATVIISFTRASSFINENVAFERVNEITTTRSRWLVAFVIDTNPYQEILTLIAGIFQDIRANLMQTWEVVPNLSSLSQDRLINILNIMYGEIVNLERSHTFLEEELAEIHSIHRSKRSLIPIVGKALSFLFGTLSEADIDAIRHNVVKLAEGQKKLQHVVEGSLTILKTTQGQTVNNTRAINEIIDDLVQLKELSQNLTDEVRELQQYTEIYARYDRAATEVQVLIDIARDFSQNLKVQINMVSMGHLSPAVIAPSELRRLLLDVKSKINSQFKFPFEPEEDIWTFYKTLTCTTLMESKQFVVIISIPLLDNIASFEVYKIHNMAIPLNGSNQTNILATYSLESEAIAVNKQRTQFAALSNSELRDCSDPLKAYCTFMSPVYAIMSTKMCVIQVFLGQREGINKFCKSIISTNAPSPQARYLTDGHWVITSATPLIFSVLCNSTSYTTKVITTKTPVDIVSLELTCSAFNGYMTLLPFYQRRTKFNLTDQVRQFINNYQFGLINVWKDFESKLPNFSDIKIPSKLIEKDEIPMDSLIEELKNNQIKLEPMPASPPYWKYLLIAIGVVFILAIVFVFRRRLRKCISKFKICTRSVKGGNQRVGRHTQNHPEGQQKAPSRRDDPTDKVPEIFISGPSVTYKPNSGLAAEYLREKYVVIPQQSSIRTTQWGQSQHVNSDRGLKQANGYEYGTHPAGGFYFRQMEKIIKEETEPTLPFNVNMVTSDQPEHGVLNVGADNAASSPPMQTVAEEIQEDGVNITGKQYIYPSIRKAP